MIYNLSVGALTVLIFITPGVKLDKMLLSFHGRKQKRKKDACGGKERIAAITPAGRLNTQGFSVTAKEPSSFKHTRPHFAQAPENVLNKT